MHFLKSGQNFFPIQAEPVCIILGCTFLRRDVSAPTSPEKGKTYIRRQVSKNLHLQSFIPYDFLAAGHSVSQEAASLLTRYGHLKLELGSIHIDYV